MRHVNKYLVLLIYLGISGCLDPFDPNVPESDQSFVVVDGIVTDQPGPYTVKISRSTSLNGDSDKVTGAQVSIEVQNGGTETLIETRDGVYETSTLQGEIGKSYRLNINTGGQTYQSTWETIYPSPVIDSVYYQIRTIGTTDVDEDEDVVQFFVDSRGPDDGPRYFRYEMEEVWKIGVFWPSFSDYIGNDQVVRTTNPRHTCWKYWEPSGINIATTVGLKSNVLSKHKIAFVGKEEERFTRRYSILVKQFALEEKEYLFWKNLKESNEDLGSIFDKQPARVLGNLTNVTNPDENVLGYFSASGVQEERVYVKAADVTPSLRRRPFCNPMDTLKKADFEELEDYEETLVTAVNSGRSFFIGFYFSEIGGNVLGALLALPKCSDCTLKGGDVNEPEFWEE